MDKTNSEKPRPLNLFRGEEQYETFDRMREHYPSSTMTAAPVAFEFPEGAHIDLPGSFSFGEQEFNTEDFLAETGTTALLVLKEGAVVYERYEHTGGRHVNWLSMSVAKSFTATAVGIAVDEGLIEAIADPITNYLPTLKGSAYDGVAIKDILQMSSGARWNEDYSDPEADINKLGVIMSEGGDLNAFAATLKKDCEAGTLNHYNSMDTQVLGFLLKTVTQRTVADYMEEKIWHPLGMESPAYWCLDATGMEMTFFGLNATARDYAKMGELYRQGGRWNGKQIVSEAWIKAASTPDAPHIMPGWKEGSLHNMGYGYQWWVPDGHPTDYTAIGVYNQFIYINPETQNVIVKLSANKNYAVTATAECYRELETFELFRAISKGA